MRSLHRFLQRQVRLTPSRRHPPKPLTECIVIFDSLYSLAENYAPDLPSFLSSLIGPLTSLLGTYHVDVPLSLGPPSSSSYSPHPLTLLRYIATTILTMQSLAHVLAKKHARDRSLVEPRFGLDEAADGVLMALGANDARGTVVSLEYRRKSGRSVEESFFLPALRQSTASRVLASRGQAEIMLLEDHPLYRASEKVERTSGDGLGSLGMDGPGSVADATTFDLGLTEKQKRDRDGVVLPYFDAQSSDGSGGLGGRILYEMGSEDDFDEEEDEI